MNAKEAKALERLTPKLSALRKTLRGEERKLLDRMVLGMASEVSAHSARVGQKIPASKTPSAQPRSSEVSLHSASVGQKIPASKTPSADARIELDASKGVYRITTI